MNRALRFSISHWAAWAPGVTSADAWLRWFAEPCLPTVDDSAPGLNEMPPMLRRRVDRLGRMALQVAYWGMMEQAHCPTVFASRYGDMKRSTELLEQLARQEPISPAGFSTSVHNAVGALFSIARGDTSNSSAIAAGAETIEAAFTEAAAMLDAGAHSVLVVYFDEPLPHYLLEFSESLDFPRAWACRISAALAADTITLESHATEQAPAPGGWAPDLLALRFLASGLAAHENVTPLRTWRWQRHAGVA